ETEFDYLRRSLIGTSTVSKTPLDVRAEWGPTCLQFLQKMYEHPSKASKTYYHKNHLQYFHSVHRSLGELSRVLKTNGKCILVVQDSYYKELHNDLPSIFVEMAQYHGLSLFQRVD